MARRQIDIGIVGNDGTGDSIREAFRKVNDNFNELYSIFGQSGTINLQDLDNVIKEERSVKQLTTGAGTMYGTVTPNDGTPSFQIIVTATDGNIDQLTCANTIPLKINDKIVFSGNVFGTIVSGTIYYINTIPSGTKFTISLTQDGLGINRVLTSDNTGQNVKPRIMQGQDGIVIDAATDPEKVIIKNTGGRLSSDSSATLGSPLNANDQVIAYTREPSDTAAQIWNSVFGNVPGGKIITPNDIVINKGYADKNYIRKTGGSSSGQIRVRDEPPNKNEYTKNIEEYSSGNAKITSHGFDSSIDGASYTYSSTGTDATGLKSEIFITDTVNFISGRTFKITVLGSTNWLSIGAGSNPKVGDIFVATGSGSGTGKVKPVYFLKYVNADLISFHPTQTDANNGSNKINVTETDPSAVETITDAYLDDTLVGNWISNEALPRKSVVRRQGDIMSGPLTLHDHPNPFQGVGIPNGPDDLQAATKYYVDNSSFTSELNLYVSTTGSDVQTNTPPGKEGRSFAYAFKTLGKACELAEFVMSRAPAEPGPYRQLIAFNNGASLSVVYSYTPAEPGALATIKFTNYNGQEVDQREDITPGKVLMGRLSGAIGIIEKYYGDDGSGDGVDYVKLINVKGTYIPGENLEFGENVRNLHITIHIESGIYEEDYPIKVPRNTAIVGDEFRRVLVRPKDRISQSPWVDTWFFRNSTFDGLSIVNGGSVLDTDLQGYYGYHYYKKPNLPLSPGPKYVNNGGYTTAANLIDQNRVGIQNAIVLYINNLPGTNLTLAEEEKSIRDTGFILDAIIADMIEGGYEKIVNIQEVYSQVTLSAECKQGLAYISTYINSQSWFTAQPTTVKNLVSSMISRIMYGFNPAYNTPKNNKDMDVFLCNDSTIVRQITCQGHGGFMMVLDPAGQILTKSPYCQQSGSFSGSINKQAFRGGQYIDGFAGNLKPTVIEKMSDYRLKITDIPREPETPTSFFLNGERFKVNTWLPSTNAKVNAGLILSLNKQFLEAQSMSYLDTFGIKYSSAEFLNYVHNILEALIFDVTNVGNIKTSDVARKLFRLDDLTLRVPTNQKTMLMSLIDYIKDSALVILANDPSDTLTTNQSKYTQVIDATIQIETAIGGLVEPLMDNLYNIVDQGIETADALDYPELILLLDPNPLFNDVSFNPTSITLITPGNTSMLSNDYTQVNDLGYGIVTNNKGLAECVSVFSYYCWTSMFSANGGQIRSLNSSSANGEYGLVALGGDPLEVPDVVDLADDMIQVARVIKTGAYLTEGMTEGLSIFVTDFQYLPYNVSIVEIDHGGSIGQTRYEMSNVTVVETTGNIPVALGGVPTVIKLNFNTSGNNDSSTSGLLADLVHEQNVIIRGGQNFKFNNVIDTNPVRPSTALTFEGDPDLTNAPVYRVIAYGITGPDKEDVNKGDSTPDRAILTTDTTYNYIALVIDPDKISESDPLNSGRTLGATAGDRRIAVTPIGTDAVPSVARLRLNTGQMTTAWDGKIHRVVSITESADASYDIVTLDEVGINLNNSPVASGIQSPLTTAVPAGKVTLRCGLRAGEQANIRVRISTLRATGHDFLDIGTGGYNTSNYPSKIYGAPRTPNQANEVEERTSGRVFYVSTDQNGFFRVGRFFTVDQGTGTVKFAASIALSNLDGIGFKRGVEISEFTDDPGFTDLANDAVPTERAVDGYINRRLGLSKDNQVVTDRIGPGYLPLNGALNPVNNISWGGYRITSLGYPSNASDATNKTYVDTVAGTLDSLGKLNDVITNTASYGDLLVSFGSITGSENIRGFAAAGVEGDFTTSITAVSSTLTTAIAATGSINTISLTNASLFPGTGYVKIDNEVFYYGSKSGNNLDLVVRQSLLDNTLDAKFKKGLPESHSIGANVIHLNTLKVNYQLNSQSIVNSDVNDNAGILQSKLSMRKADLFDESDLVTGWNNVNKTQEDLGLAKFSDENFEIDQGYVRLKVSGVQHNRIQNVNIRSVLANNTSFFAQAPTNVFMRDVIKTGLYDLIQNSTHTPGRLYTWTVTKAALEINTTQQPTEISTNADNFTIVQRNNQGRIQVNGIETDDAIVVLSFSGSDDTATPVTYKGQWSPGINASLVATSANNLVGNTVGSIPYQSGTNTTSFLSPDTAGKVLRTNGASNAPSWVEVSSLSVGSASSTANSITFNDSGSGAGTGTTFNGAAPVTISYNSIGAASSGHTHTSLTSITEISTGASTTAGTITGAWTLTGGSTLQATYADLAEWYTSDKKYEPGTVLVFGGLLETTTTNQLSDTRVAGVVTTNPAYTMNTQIANTSHSVCIALQGRVPCKVVGRVQKGDLLTTSASPGYAIKATNPVLGSIIGKALENKDSLEAGVIEIAVGRT